MRNLRCWSLLTHPWLSDVLGMCRRIPKPGTRWLNLQLVSLPGRQYLLLTMPMFQVLFRAALLPHPAVDGLFTPSVLVSRSAIPLAAFVLYHLVNPSKRAKAVFWDWRFLSLAGLLGAGCSFSYLLTGAVLAPTIPLNSSPHVSFLLSVVSTAAPCNMLSFGLQLYGCDLQLHGLVTYRRIECSVHVKCSLESFPWQGYYKLGNNVLWCNFMECS